MRSAGRGKSPLTVTHASSYVRTHPHKQRQQQQVLMVEGWGGGSGLGEENGVEGSNGRVARPLYNLIKRARLFSVPPAWSYTLHNPTRNCDVHSMLMKNKRKDIHLKLGLLLTVARIALFHSGVATQAVTQKGEDGSTGPSTILSHSHEKSHDLWC